ncbi:MAG: prepilin-type N-terminal cleavage/methylation domain-containing protein [Gallionella sp.]|nr:prepilin-type N-terminal cleavage/methylation domain-containing protein [Gallionella sp.]MDD4946211.1 prepilin-type N-terminal cleavage/methylation domain-containing protein [Gallionella sp.]MDD5611673.1 prepilin-type N-terminal cleavage/methylation domain-containing protein [Gallionella sp.]
MTHSQKGYTMIEVLIVMAIIGILAALAMSSYQYNIAKSQSVEAFDLLGGLKSTIIADVAQEPSVYTCGLPPKSVTSGNYVASIVAQWNPPNCDLVATFANTGIAQPLRGKTVILRFDSTTGFFVMSKAATGFTLPAEYVPSNWK